MSVENQLTKSQTKEIANSIAKYVASNPDAGIPIEDDPRYIFKMAIAAYDSVSIGQGYPHLQRSITEIISFLGRQGIYGDAAKEVLDEARHLAYCNEVEAYLQLEAAEAKVRSLSHAGTC